jgi:hypothetical protein
VAVPPAWGGGETGWSADSCRSRTFPRPGRPRFPPVPSLSRTPRRTLLRPARPDTGVSWRTVVRTARPGGGPEHHGGLVPPAACPGGQLLRPAGGRDQRVTGGRARPRSPPGDRIGGSAPRSGDGAHGRPRRPGGGERRWGTVAGNGGAQRWWGTAVRSGGGELRCGTVVRNGGGELRRAGVVRNGGGGTVGGTAARNGGGELRCGTVVRNGGGDCGAQRWWGTVAGKGRTGLAEQLGVRQRSVGVEHARPGQTSSPSGLSRS